MLFQVPPSCLLTPLYLPGAQCEDVAAGLSRKAERKVAAVFFNTLGLAQDPSPGMPNFSLIRTLGLQADSGLTSERGP